MNALGTLQAAWSQRGSLLSVGLEPCPEYLPASGEFEPSIEGYEAYLAAIIEATGESAAAYKFNLAFFEDLGPDGWALLKRTRDRVPETAMVISDAKRGDIGSTAKRYAHATFDWLNADAVTLSPLMGRDSAEPFLARRERLCFFLCLTSNPGSSDFLGRNRLYLDIARTVRGWNTAGNCGLVVGATHPAQVGEIRAAAGEMPFLVPGVGAQGGEVETICAAGGQRTGGQAASGANFPGLLFHVTRGLLPDVSNSTPFVQTVRTRAEQYRARLAVAARSLTSVPSHA